MQNHKSILESKNINYAFIRNLDKPKGLCNGTRIMVPRLEAKIIAEKNVDKITYISRISMFS